MLIGEPYLHPVIAEDLFSCANALYCNVKPRGGGLARHLVHPRARSVPDACAVCLRKLPTLDIDMVKRQTSLAFRIANDACTSPGLVKAEASLPGVASAAVVQSELVETGANALFTKLDGLE